MLSSVMQKGIDKIYTHDFKTQKFYIDTIIQDARGVSLDIVYELQAFFVPNDKYMIEYFGTDILSKDYDSYNFEGECYWTGYLVFPIRDVKNKIVGLVGYNPFIAIENKEKGIWDRPYYRHSNKDVMNKSLFLFGGIDYYKKALKEGYIVLTDGVFDMINCTQNGLVSGALLGSYVSIELAAMLYFIPNVYLAMDNDNAGLSVYNQLKRYVPQTKLIKQGKYKDIDDLLKSEYKDKAIETIKSNLNSSNDILLRF